MLRVKVVFPPPFQPNANQDFDLSHALAMQIYNAGTNKNLWAAMRIYDHACSTGNVNTKTHDAMIIAAGKNGRPDLALIPYRHAIAMWQATHSHYRNMIIAAGNNKNMRLAVIAYNDALKAGMASVSTHNAMRNAARSNGDTRWAAIAHNNILDLMTRRHPRAEATSNLAIDQKDEKSEAVIEPHYIASTLSILYDDQELESRQSSTLSSSAKTIQKIMGSADAKYPLSTPLLSAANDQKSASASQSASTQSNYAAFSPLFSAAPWNINPARQAAQNNNEVKVHTRAKSLGNSSP